MIAITITIHDLDISNITHMINYNLSTDIDDYLFFYLSFIITFMIKNNLYI